MNKNGEVINCLFPVLELGVKTLLHTKLLISAFLTVDIVIFLQEIADLVCCNENSRILLQNRCPSALSQLLYLLIAHATPPHLS